MLQPSSVQDAEIDHSKDSVDDDDSTESGDKSRVHGSQDPLETAEANENKSEREVLQKEESQSCPIPSEIKSKAFDSTDELCKHKPK